MTKPLHLHFDGIDDCIRADQNMPRQWPDEWKEDMKIYRRWYEGFRIPWYVRRLQKKRIGKRDREEGRVIND